MRRTKPLREVTRARVPLEEVKTPQASDLHLPRSQCPSSCFAQDAVERLIYCLSIAAQLLRFGASRGACVFASLAARPRRSLVSMGNTESTPQAGLDPAVPRKLVSLSSKVEVRVRTHSPAVNPRPQLAPVCMPRPRP